MTENQSKSNIKRILDLVISVFLTTSLFSQPVTLNWIGNKPLFKTGVSWGVPFEKGKVQKNQSFLLTAENTEIPLQTWPLAYWPDGSVKWLGLATVTDLQQNFQLDFSNTERKSAGITVEQSPDLIQVNTGTLTCEIDTKGKCIFKNLKVNGKIISENGRLICILEDRSKINEKTIQYNDFESIVNEVEVEQTGSVRTVIKVTGKLKDMKTKREVFPFTVRMYFYAGIQQVRLVHTFIYDGNQDKDFIKGLGIEFDVPFRQSIQNRHICFSGENGGLWSEPVKPIITRSPFVYKGDRNIPKKQISGELIPEITSDDSIAYTWFSHLPEWNDYKLSQVNANGFTISKRTNSQSSWLFANAGKRSSGMALAGDVSGGIAVSMKDFWQSYPSSLEINNASKHKAELKAWFWSPEAEAMDLRHYDTIAHDLDATYEDVQPGLSTPYGIARTNELTLFAFDELPSKNKLAQMAQMASESHLLACTPDYFHSVKAFGSWSLPDHSNETKQWIENQLDSSFMYYQRAVEEHNWYGFWNYGDVMHTYDPLRHVWRYDIGGFAWDNTELAPNNWLWYSFLRSGRADIFKMAEAMTRHTGEVDAYHTGEMKGLGSRHNVSHWGCGSKEVRIGQAAWKRFFYYLTTDERCGDLMREALEAEKAIVKYEPLRIAQPREKFPYNAPTRLRWGPDWLALAGNWMTEWERTGDKKYRDKILIGLKSLSNLPNNLFTGPNGLGYDPVTGKMTYDGDPNRTNKSHLATIMGGFEILSEMFEMIDYKPFRKTFTEYCKFYSMPADDPLRTPKTAKWGDINFRTPRLTAFAAKELNDDKLATRAWNEFLGAWRRRQPDEVTGLRNMYSSTLVTPPLVLNPVHENPFVSTNSTAQWGLNAIFMLDLIGDKIPDTKTLELKKTFSEISSLNWKTVFEDNFRKNWEKNWFLDGEKAQLTNTKNGLLFKAGPIPANDEHHAVLWTKQSFEKDIRVEFDFTKKDNETKFVNIIYLLAQGSGKGIYDKDISKWSEMRKIPAMKNYFNHLNVFHISFAAYENDNSNPAEDYIRARRYLPESETGLNGTNLKPDYSRTGLFKTNEKQHITIILKGENIFMKVKENDKEFYCHWETNEFPTLNSGRIGLRLMGSRVSEFENFKVFRLK